jgi:Protein of unknown function (DUF1566)
LISLGEGPLFVLTLFFEGDEHMAYPHKGATSPEPKIGEKMPDGTVFAGISPDTNKPMYTTPADAPLTMTFNDAQKYAATLDAHGHKDWCVPTPAELKVLFNNQAAIGGFDVTGSDPAGWHWSASLAFKGGAWGQRFSSGGYQFGNAKDLRSSVRCVRCE